MRRLQALAWMALWSGPPKFLWLSYMSCVSVQAVGTVRCGCGMAAALACESDGKLDGAVVDCGCDGGLGVR